MGYEVLARKWRPQTFDEVVGQEHITRTLKKAALSRRLSHAYLFAGPRGCGKTSTARILAKVINCTDLQDGNPCDRCDSCRGVIQGRNLDVMEIDGASHTGVDQVRDLQESIGYAPSQFSNKIYIIDEVHMLSMHAFNALLKTLEEPPAHVYFIFATTAPHKVPDTIKSRCQRHHFKRLEIAEIIDQLGKVCEAEKIEWEPEALRLLARKAEGSMRDGESLLDQCITASGGRVTSAAVRDILGLLDPEMVLEFLRTIAGKDPTAVIRRLDDAVRGGVDLEELLGALIEGYRDLMLLAVPGDLSELIYRSRDEIESMRRVRESYELPDLVTMVERLCNTAPRLKMAGDPRILLESVLVDLALLDRQTDVRDLIARLERSGEGPKATGPAATTGKPKAGPPPESADSQGRRAAARPAAAATEPPAPAVKLDTPPDRARAERAEEAPEKAAKDVELSALGYAELRKLWDGFVTYVRQKKVALGVCLISGTLKSLDDRSVVLRFARGFSFQKEQVESPSNRKFLQGMLQKYFGRELEIVCLGEGEEARAEKVEAPLPETEEGEPRAGRPIEKKPIVKKILADFDGEIVKYNT